MRYKRRRAAACSGSDGEDEILPSQHRKRAIDAMEGRLANLAGEVSALQSQLEDLRKLHGELAAEGDILQARLQGVPQEVNLANRQSEAQALGSGSTRGSDPGSTFHFSIFTTAEPASPGGHGSAERRRPHSKCRTAPDARSADYQTDQLVQPNPLPVDFWDEIMMPNYQDEYAEAEVAASSEGVLQFAAGSTTGSPADGVNPPLNSSISTPAPPSASSAASLTPAACVGGSTHLAPAPNCGKASAFPSSDTPGLMVANAIGQGFTKIMGYPDAAMGAFSESISCGGPSYIPGMEALLWQQQQQQHELAQPYIEPSPLPQHFHQPPVQSGQRILPQAAAPLMSMTAQPLQSAASCPRSPSQHQLRMRYSIQPLPQQHQHQQPGSHLFTGDGSVRRRPRWVSWPPDSVPADIALLARSRVTVAGENILVRDGTLTSDTASAAFAAANVTTVPTGDTATGLPLTAAAGSWLGASPAPPATTPATPSAPFLSSGSAPPASQRNITASTATAAGPVSSFAGSSRDRDGGGAAVGLLGGDLTGLSMTSRFANGVKGQMAHGGRGYPGGGPAAAVAALLHDAGMAPAAGTDMGGSVSTVATGAMGMGLISNGTGTRISAGAKLLRSAPSAESVAAQQDQQSQQQQQQQQQQQVRERQEQQLLQIQLQEQQQLVQQHMQHMQLHSGPRVKGESPDRLVGVTNTAGVGMSAKSTDVAGAGMFSHGRVPPVGALSSAAGSGNCQEPAADAAGEGGAGGDGAGVGQIVDRLGALTSIEAVQPRTATAAATHHQSGDEQHLVAQQNVGICPNSGAVKSCAAEEQKSLLIPVTDDDPTPGGSPDAGDAAAGAMSAATQAADRMAAVATRQGKPVCRDAPNAVEPTFSSQLQPLSRSQSAFGGGGSPGAAAGALPMPGPGSAVTTYGQPWTAPYGSPQPPYTPPYNTAFPVPMRYGSSPAGRPVMWRRMAVRLPPPGLMSPLPLPGPSALAPPGAVSVCAMPSETADAAKTSQAASGATASPTGLGGGRSSSASYTIAPQGAVLS